MENFWLSSIGIVIFFVHEGSSSGLWNWATYGCYKAYTAERRLLGLNYNSFYIRSSASSEAVGSKSLSFFALVAGKLSNIVAARGLLIESTSD